MKLNIPKTDVVLTKDGKWFPYINGFEVKVARLNSRGYIKALQKAMKENAEQISEDNDKSAELQRKLMAEIYADHVLVDWRGLVDEDESHGDTIVLIPYSRQLVIELLSDAGYDHLYKFVTAKANVESNYYIEQSKDSVKN